MNNPILTFTNWVWGYPLLIWLVGGGLFLTIRYRFLQFRKLGFILKNTIGKAFKDDGRTGEGKISGFKAVTGALASTLGAGNIVGTAIAIGYGGPGGVFWLWLTGLVACAIKYSEVVLAMKYREKDKKGNWVGGPQYYLTKATGWKWISLAYAVCCALSLFLAASAQIGSVVDTIEALHVPRLATTAVLIIAAALIVLGGMSRLLNFTEKIVPVMSVVYILGGLAVIFINFRNIPEAFFSVFRYAFTGRAAFGGFGGATVAMCIRWGVSRGLYSNDSGGGVTTITHAAADVNHPVQQGMWAIFEVFFDTIVVCSITCFVILTTGVWQTETNVSTLTLIGFQRSLGPVLGGFIVSLSLVMFCFTTAVAQTLFGCSQLVKIFGESAGIWGKYVYLGLMFAGGMVGISALISYVDFGSFLITFINMFVVYRCHGEVKKLTEEYFKDTKKWETEKWLPWVEMEEEATRNMENEAVKTAERVAVDL